MLSEKPWKWEDVTRLLLGLLATVCFGILLGSLLQPLIKGLPETDQKMLNLIIGVLAFQGSGLLWIVFFLREQKVSWSAAFGFQSPRLLRTIFLGLAAGAVVLPLVLALQRLSDRVLQIFHADTQPQESVQVFKETVAQAAPSATTVGEQIFFTAFVILLAPVAEEILFRGILYPTIKQAGFPQAALWTTSILFALSHFTAITILPLTFFALVLVALYEITDNLLAPILAHSFFNAANVVIMFNEQRILEFLHLTEQRIIEFLHLAK